MKVYVSIAILIVFLITCAFWAISNFFDARANAEQASADLDSCHAIVARINALRMSTGVATADEVDQVALQRRVEDSLHTVGLLPSHVLQVAPDMPRALGNSAYVEVPTNLTLRDMTLRQTVGFLLAIAGDHSPLQPRALRLSSPHAGSDGASSDVQWTAEVTIAYVTVHTPVVSNVLNSDEKDEGR